jgi:hypothetical protein
MVSDLVGPMNFLASPAAGFLVEVVRPTACLTNLRHLDWTMSMLVFNCGDVYDLRITKHTNVVF